MGLKISKCGVKISFQIWTVDRFEKLTEQKLIVVNPYKKAIRKRLENTNKNINKLECWKTKTWPCRLSPSYQPIDFSMRNQKINYSLFSERGTIFRKWYRDCSNLFCSVADNRSIKSRLLNKFQVISIKTINDLGKYLLHSSVNRSAFELKN
ncbi:hypothetical protein BpHYR1_013305 [Brachionus plicatilis]|uniref:Uncharacterized protein n=1 Tax=Brachionus plicatilis TaxID=10195 RepID=A0A3M7R5U6_BRAPC|nr:hypothetical protein BpHYR1_013305 [Brachionus plicatilis]